MVKLRLKSFAYPGGSELLREINWELDPYEAYVLKGENGCGKTTLLRILAGAQKLSAEEAKGYFFSFDGRKMAPGAVPPGIYHLPQNPLDALLGLYPEQDLQIWKMAVPSLDLAAIAADCRYEGFLQSSYYQMSSGQLRYASLLALPYLKRLFWLLDEPFAGLDSGSSEWLLQLLKDKLSLGVGMIVVSHEAFLAESLGAKILDMGVL